MEGFRKKMDNKEMRESVKRRLSSKGEDRGLWGKLSNKEVFDILYELLVANEGVYNRPDVITRKEVCGLMDYLRIKLKYDVFDLEATRRENCYLRKLLELPDE